MRAFKLLVLLALFAAQVFPEGNDTLPPIPPSESVLIIKAVYPNGSAMANSPIVLLARTKADQSNFSVFRLITDSSGAVFISLGKAQYELDAIANIPSTPGADFASTSAVDASRNSTATMVFYPAGSITGSVSYNGLPVADAEVSISCPSNSFDYARINGAVDAKAGAFSVLAIPVGRCAVSASSGSLASSQEIDVAQGQTSSAKLELLPIAGEREQQASSLPTLALLGFLALLAAAIAYFVLFGKGKGKGAKTHGEKSMLASSEGKRGKQPKAKSAMGKPSTKTPSSKRKLAAGKMVASLPNAPASAAQQQNEASVQAVLSTLSEREREIAECLMSSGGRAKRSTLQHKLLIPKTSLIRNLRSLERKNLVKLTPFGRNMVAEACGALSR